MTHGLVVTRTYLSDHHFFVLQKSSLSRYALRHPNAFVFGKYLPTQKEIKMRRMVMTFFGMLTAVSIVLAISLSTTYAAPNDVPVAQTTPVSATGTVNTTVNLRSGPGTGFAITRQVRSGQRLSITGSEVSGTGQLWYRLENNEWIAGFLVVEVRVVQSPTPTPTPTRFSTARMTAAIVTKIVDGDTIDVRIGSATFRVRYIGMDTPERGEDFFAEASEVNRTLVLEKAVYLEKDVSEVDRFDRLLRYVYLADGTFVNAEMVLQGMAVASTYAPDVKYQELLRLAQQEAVTGGMGMWAKTAVATAIRSANLRGGPGTDYPVVGSVGAGQALDVVARNPAGDWLQLGNDAWIFGTLVADAPTDLSIAQNIPAPPAPAPVVIVSAPASASPSVPAQPESSQPAAAAQVVIATVFYDGAVFRVESDEYAVITNRGSASVNLAGWRLNAGDNGQDFRFPNFDLGPGQSCRVYTNEIHPESCGFSFGKGQAIWNNKGNECGLLFDSGGVEVSRYCY